VPRKNIEGIDKLIHLGDFEADAERIAERLGLPYAAVKGNCDGAMRSQDSRYILETEYGNIYLTHGHCDGVSGGSVDRLIYRCQELGCKAAFFGHTHVALNMEVEGIRILNPGSISRPRDGSNGTYAIVHTYPDRIECSVMYYNPGSGRGSTSGAKGGYLRNLLNNSDRF